MTYIYHIPYPAGLEHEDFAGMFTELDMEGMEEAEKELKVYLDESQVSDGEAYIRELCEDHGIRFQKSVLEEKNWNARWESSFQPIQIDDYVLVRSSFHPENSSVKYEIIIEPKMSFGTGHHPTTEQMMRLMRLLELKGKSILDCGSGTGILALLAEKAGAGEVLALDNDEWCYRNCLENMALNGSTRIVPLIGGLEKVEGRGFDVVLANIHRNFLVEHMQALSDALGKGGYLLVSGFYAEDAQRILDAALAAQLIAHYESTKENWDCILFEKNTADHE